MHTEVNTAGERRNGDRVAAIVLLLITGVVAAGLAFAGLMLVMSSDSCGTYSGGDCNTGLFTLAWLLTMAFPLGGYTATAVYTGIRIAGKRRAVWIPLAGLAIYGAGYAASVALAFFALE